MSHRIMTMVGEKKMQALHRKPKQPPRIPIKHAAQKYKAPVSNLSSISDREGPNCILNDALVEIFGEQQPLQEYIAPIPSQSIIRKRCADHVAWYSSCILLFMLYVIHSFCSEFHLVPLELENVVIGAGQVHLIHPDSQVQYTINATALYVDSNQTNGIMLQSLRPW